MLPAEIKNSSNIEIFKNKISNCKLCQDYLHRIGYVDFVDD